MSSYYTRVIPEPVALRTYGFQSVSPQEMKSIVMRMQRPTHSSDIGGYFPDGYFKHPHRPKSGLCQRAKPTNEELLRLRSAPRHRIPEKMIHRVVRRLQTPTMSYLAACGETNYEPLPPRERHRPRTAEERGKSFHRLIRPTTASKRKDIDAYWEEATNSDLYDTDYVYDDSVEKDELDSIIDRVRAPTVSSQGADQRRCPKRKPSLHINRDKLPLVSGLARSSRVEDIVTRLNRPTTASSARRHTPAATETVTYNN